jgi:hypothetical protein
MASKTMKVSPDLKSLGTGDLYLVKRPSGIFYAENRHKERVSLRTRQRAVAEEIMRGHKAAVEKPNFAYKVALAYLGETDPDAQNRTWLDVIDAYIKRSAVGPTRKRLETAKKDKALQKILKLNLLQDRPRQAGLFFEALNIGRVSTNVFLRKFHNFALDMGWSVENANPHHFDRCGEQRQTNGPEQNDNSPASDWLGSISVGPRFRTDSP